jgi:hypothetical protein
MPIPSIFKLFGWRVGGVPSVPMLDGQMVIVPRLFGRCDASMRPRLSGDIHYTPRLAGRLDQDANPDSPTSAPKGP